MFKTTDFLIRYDLAKSDAERADLLADEFARQIDRDIFQTLIDNPLSRAIYELTFNGSMRFEDYGPLRQAGLVFNSNDYTPRVVYDGARLELVSDIALTPAGSAWRPHVPDWIDPIVFIGPYIEGYLWRSTKDGIVAARDPLTDALSIADVDVLRLIRNPATGREYLPMEHPEIWSVLMDQDPPEDIEAARRTELSWWTDENRPTVLHDLSGLPPASEYYRFLEDGEYDELAVIRPGLSYHEYYLEKIGELCGKVGDA